MINYDKEKLFVKKFITKIKADRLIFELQSEKRRRDALWRFCHGVENLIKIDLIDVKDRKMSPQDIYKKIRENSNDNTGYVISLDNGIDGHEFELFEALEKSTNSGLASIVLVGKNIVVIVAEQEHGSAEKYILKSQWRNLNKKWGAIKSEYFFYISWKI